MCNLTSKVVAPPHTVARASARVSGVLLPLLGRTVAPCGTALVTHHSEVEQVGLRVPGPHRLCSSCFRTLLLSECRHRARPSPFAADEPRIIAARHASKCLRHYLLSIRENQQHALFVRFEWRAPLRHANSSISVRRCNGCGTPRKKKLISK